MLVPCIHCWSLAVRAPMWPHDDRCVGWRPGATGARAARHPDHRRARAGGHTTSAHRGPWGGRSGRTCRRDRLHRMREERLDHRRAAPARPRRARTTCTRPAADVALPTQPDTDGRRRRLISAACGRRTRRVAIWNVLLPAVMIAAAPLAGRALRVAARWACGPPLPRPAPPRKRQLSGARRRPAETPAPPSRSSGCHPADEAIELSLPLTSRRPGCRRRRATFPGDVSRSVLVIVVSSSIPSAG